MTDKFDVICFDDNCINNKMQLFCSLESASELHYRESHETVPIHQGQTFFKNLKICNSPMSISKDSCLSSLKAKFQQKKAQIIKSLDQHYKKAEESIVSYYEMSHENLQFKDFEKNLTQKTNLTQNYLSTLTWLHKESSFDVNQCLKQMIKKKTNIQEEMFERIQNDIVHAESFFQHPRAQIKQSNKLKLDPFYLRHQPQRNNFTQIHRKVEENAQRPQKPKKIYKKFEKKQELVVTLSQELISSREKIGFKTISKVLKDKIEKSNNLHKYLLYIFGVVFRQIEQLTINKFYFKKIPKTHKLLILPEFKNFRKWLRPEDSLILIDCVKLFLDLDTQINVGFFQIYVLYVNFVITIRKISFGKKDAQINYNTEPTDIQRQISFLYYHYNNLDIVVNLLTQKYHLSRFYKQPTKIIEQFIQLMKDTYNKMQIKQNYSSELFFKQIQKEYNNKAQVWEKIREKIIRYEIINQISEQEEEQLTRMIRSVLNKEKRQEGFQLQTFRKGKRMQKKLKEVCLSSDDETDKHQEKHKIEVIRNTKVPKLELIESDSSDNGLECQNIL